MEKLELNVGFFSLFLLDLCLWALLESNQRPPPCKGGALDQLS